MTMPMLPPPPPTLILPLQPAVRPGVRPAQQPLVLPLPPERRHWLVAAVVAVSAAAVATVAAAARGPVEVVQWRLSERRVWRFDAPDGT